MKQSHLFALWGGLFSICAALSFIPAPDGFLRWVLSAAALLFFLPPVWLLWQAKRTGDKKTCQLIRNLSAASLGLTLLLLIANILSVTGSETLGRFLYAVMAVVSVPMVCSGYWFASLFLWACLLAASKSE